MWRETVAREKTICPPSGAVGNRCATLPAGTTLVCGDHALLLCECLSEVSEIVCYDRQPAIARANSRALVLVRVSHLPLAAGLQWRRRNAGQRAAATGLGHGATNGTGYTDRNGRQQYANRSELDRLDRRRRRERLSNLSQWLEPHRSQRSLQPTTPIPASRHRRLIRTRCGHSTPQETYRTPRVLAVPRLRQRRGQGGLDARPSNTTCLAWDRPNAGSTISLSQFTNLTFNQPVKMLQAPNSSQHWYVLQQVGIVRRFTGTNPTSATTVLDISGRVFRLSQSEAGLLGMAFHPNFPTDSRVFLYYIDTGLVGRLRRSRRRSMPTGLPRSAQLRADPDVDQTSPPPRQSQRWRHRVRTRWISLPGHRRRRRRRRSAGERAAPHHVARQDAAHPDQCGGSCVHDSCGQSIRGQCGVPARGSRRAAIARRSTPGVCAIPGAGASTAATERSGSPTWARGNTRKSTPFSAAATTAGIAAKAHTITRRPDVRPAG